ncbi:ABC transporter permease [Pseudonocardia kujensis]|uniref:ABC transporter permease n=1 Tax=Pseudonocardia kujensis TaxID=1128675 RepID=UPI001E458343|nr:ABC transporter permease [Pseudonocardia kujensis]MCE0764757.1 ABC transporter permease [Pseudonocardia kujensis]
MTGVLAALRGSRTTLGAALFALVLFVVGTVHTAGFASGDNIRQLLVFASFVGFAALGQTLVVLGGGLDLSVPWLISFGGIQLAVLCAGGMNQVLAVVVCVVVGLLVGLVNGIGVTVFGVAPIVMTLGVGGLVQAYLLAVGLLKATGNDVPTIASGVANGALGPIPVVAVVWLVVALVVAVVLARTRFGRSVYATGENDVVAVLSGIDTGRVRMITYAVSGAASAFAGVIISGYIGKAYLEIGQPFLFASIAALVIGGASILGGRGTYFGTVVGAIALTLLNSLLPLFNLDPASLSIAYGLVILVGVRVTTTRGTGRGWGRRARRAEESEAG